MAKISTLAVASLALAGLALVGCAKKEEETTPPPTKEGASMPAPSNGAAAQNEPTMIPASNRETVRMKIDKIDCGSCAVKLEDAIKAKAEGKIADFKMDSKGNVEFVFDKTQNKPEDFVTAVNDGTTMKAQIQG